MPPVELDCQAVALTTDLRALLRHHPEFTFFFANLILLFHI